MKADKLWEPEAEKCETEIRYEVMYLHSPTSSCFQNPHSTRLVVCHQNTPAEVRAVLGTKVQRSNEISAISRTFQGDLYADYNNASDLSRQGFKELVAK